ncbi:MAG TPA: hypothetical protein VGE47_12765 [Burkholderiaceae bacterium]
MLIEKIFAALGLLTCLALAVQMLLPATQRAGLQRLWLRARYWLQDAWQRRRASPAERRRAKLFATQTIRRAQVAGREAEADEVPAGLDEADGEWEGNVYWPKRFEERRKKRKLH